MFVKHTFATAPVLPTGGGLFEYIVAQNGVFVRAERPGLQVLAPVVKAHIRGLLALRPSFKLVEKIPIQLVTHLFQMAFLAGTREYLFYLQPNPWRISVPDQVQRTTTVRPVDAFDPSGTTALVEVHSHHRMAPFFSTTDDADEKTGFRVYAVLGHLPHYPSLCVRVGIYGHFWNIPADWVFDLPGGVHDVLEVSHATQSRLS